MYWKELFDDFNKEFPSVPLWFACIFVTYAFLVIPIRAWFDCDFRIFRYQMRILFRALIIKIIRGAR